MRVFIPTVESTAVYRLLLLHSGFHQFGVDNPLTLYCHFVWNYRGQKGKKGFLVSSVKEPGFNPEYGDFEF